MVLVAVRSFGYSLADITPDISPESLLADLCIKPSIIRKQFLREVRSPDQDIKEEDQIMSTKLKVTILASSLAILLFTVVGGFVNVRASSNEGAYRQLSVYSEVLSRIRLEYVEEPNISGVTDGALHGLLESLDANSSYLSAAEYKRYKTMKTDGKADIGATVSKRFGYAAVVAVIPGGPAEKAGVENSDIIESIEGKTTHDMSLAEIHGRLGGPAAAGGTAKDCDHARRSRHPARQRKNACRQRRLHSGGRVPRR